VGGLFGQAGTDDDDDDELRSLLWSSHQASRLRGGFWIAQSLRIYCYNAAQAAIEKAMNRPGILVHSEWFQASPLSAAAGTRLELRIQCGQARTRNKLEPTFKIQRRRDTTSLVALDRVQTASHSNDAANHLAVSLSSATLFHLLSLPFWGFVWPAHRRISELEITLSPLHSIVDANRRFAVAGDCRSIGLVLEWSGKDNQS
jgi:hypothetical protein